MQEEKAVMKSLENILDWAQKTYRFRLNVNLIPSVLKGPFNKAVARFSNLEELGKIDVTKMGICEEVADLAYQTLKLCCLKHAILTETSIRILQDHLIKNNFYDESANLIGLDYLGLDELSKKLVPEKMVRDLRLLLPGVMFAFGGDSGYTILKEFLAGQFVAYISRIWRKHEAGGLQTAEYLRDKKIPEETWELVGALVKSSENFSGNDLMADLKQNLRLIERLMCVVEIMRSERNLQPTGFSLLFFLPDILEQKMDKKISVENTLHLMFLKMKGRQEMDFCGYDKQTMRLTCKPVEYLIEADMFF